MDGYIIVLIAGFTGGVVRGLVGFIKHQFKFKNVPFKPMYFFGMMFISGIIGVLTAAAVKEAGITLLGVGKIGFGLALIIGYAGGDLIENIYKIFTGKMFLFPTE